MSGIVLTLPIIAGKVEAWRRFCQEISGSRLQMYLSSRRRLGITRERLALIENEFGATSVSTIEASNVTKALNEIASSPLPFDIWFRERFQELHGVSLESYAQFSQPTPLPHQQEVLFEWMWQSEVGEEG